MLCPISSLQCCECIEWNACCFTALDRKRIKSAPRPEIINAIPTTPADRFSFSASPRDSIVRLCPRRRWWWRRWWGRRSRRRGRRGGRWRCKYGRARWRRGRHWRGSGGKYGKHYPQRSSPAGPDRSRNARWRRPGRRKFRRSVERKHGGRSGRDWATGAAHHRRSERWWWAKRRTRWRRALIQCRAGWFWDSTNVPCRSRRKHGFESSRERHPKIRPFLSSRYASTFGTPVHLPRADRADPSSLC
jgi:hypothetical protein